MKIEKFSKIIFRGHKTNNLYTLPLGAPRHDCQRNMVAELPVFRIWQSKPCARIKYPILGCVLRTHGFGCQIRNNGRLAPIFRRQASILSYNMEAYHALVCDHTKIDAKPIFGSLDQCQNLALILETPEIGVASISVYTNTNAWDASIFYIIRVDRPQNLVSIFQKLRSKHPHTCVCYNTIYA